MLEPCHKSSQMLAWLTSVIPVQDPPPPGMEDSAAAPGAEAGGKKLPPALAARLAKRGIVAQVL